MEFWGGIVPAGKPHIIGVTPGQEILHITQVCLGEKAVDGERSVVSLKVDGKKFTIGTLQKGVADQFPVDLVLDDELTVSHTGKSEVHLTGWWQRAMDEMKMEGMDGEDSEDDGEDGKDSEDDDDSDEEPPPVKVAKPTAKTNAKPAAKAEPPKKAAKPVAVEEEAEESDDEDGSSDEEEAGSEEEEGEVEEDDESEIDEDSEDEEMGNESEEEDSEDEPPAAKKAKSAPVTPASARKDSKAPPAPMTEPKKGKGPSQEEKQYEKDLTALLKKNKKMSMAAVGGQVKKPAAVPRLKNFVLERPDKFKLVGDQLELA